MSSNKLSYYDGMIQLSYRDGTPYNNARRTPRATLITFLCDRDAGVGFPEYQVGTDRTVPSLGADPSLTPPPGACQGPRCNRLWASASVSAHTAFLGLEVEYTQASKSFAHS